MGNIDGDFDTGLPDGEFPANLEQDEVFQAPSVLRSKVRELKLRPDRDLSQKDED